MDNLQCQVEIANAYKIATHCKNCLMQWSYFDENESSEFTLEQREALAESLNTQASELSDLVENAKLGDEQALKVLQGEYGTDVNLDELTQKVNELQKVADNYPSYKFRKILSGSVDADGRTRAVWKLGDGGKYSGNKIYLSKSVYNDVINGNSGKYTLLHEIAHVAGWNHNDYTGKTFKFQKALNGVYK